MGGQIFAPGNICISTIRGGHISQRAMDGGANMCKLIITIIRIIPDTHPFGACVINRQE